MIEQTKLEGRDWHLKKTNWCGEAADNLSDEDATLDDEGLKSGDLVLIEAGRLPPKGFVRIVVYLFKPFQEQINAETVTDDTAAGLLSWVSTTLQSWISPSTSSTKEKSAATSSTKEKSEATSCKVADGSAADQPDGRNDITDVTDVTTLLKEDLRKYNLPLHGNLVEVGTLEISQDSTLEELKSQILTLPMLQEYTVPTVHFLRLRELNNNRPGKIYKQLNHNLRRHKITGYSSICCEVLHTEEDLPTTSLTFYIRVKKPGVKDYESPREIMYDCAQLGPSPNDLKKHIADLLGLPMDRLRLAKYKPEIFQWVDISNQQCASKKSNKKSSKAPKSNIKNAPISLRDGDTVGVKDGLYDADDNFCTNSDLVGQLILEAIQEEKRRSRRAKAAGDIVMESKGRRRPEVGIRIHVPDYKRTQQTNDD